MTATTPPYTLLDLDQDIDREDFWLMPTALTRAYSVLWSHRRWQIVDRHGHILREAPAAARSGGL